MRREIKSLTKYAPSEKFGSRHSCARLDAACARTLYVRYMDDIVLLTKTRWPLRRALRTLNQTLTEVKVAQHPDKTFIGRIERGFDFLDCYFSRGPLRLAPHTLQNLAARLHRLYERQTKRSPVKRWTQKTAPSDPVSLDEYVAHWRRWCRAGLGLLDPSELALLYDGAPAYPPGSNSDS